VVNISKDQETIQSLALSDLLSRLDLSKDISDTRMPTYEDLNPEGWLSNRESQEKHQEIVRKIVNWPIDDNYKVRYTSI
jgi:hypothetical protein